MPRRWPPGSWCSTAERWLRSVHSKTCAHGPAIVRARSRTWCWSCSGCGSDMLARELAIVLRARVTWLQAALAALLVGHGFVLAIDLYSAGSRSALAERLMSREFDPLLGLVRPTLGGLYLALSLLGPLVAARPLAVEKERRTFGALLLQTGAPLRLAVTKATAALAGVGLQLVAPVVLLAAWWGIGGHLGLVETAVALFAYVLYLTLITAVSVAAAAWTDTLAQAATVAVLVVAASWAIDASEGFAALAWLGRALDWSVTTHLGPMERGTLALGACLWMVAMTLGALGLAWLGVRADLGRPRRLAATMLVLLATASAGALASRVRRGFDLTEDRRASLPPAAVQGLRTLPGPVAVEVWLDRDDARRQQVESDALAKLRLARTDLEVTAPTDGRLEPDEAIRDDGYGRIIVRVGAVTRETHSTSRKEIVTLLFEAAGRPVPDWSQPEYPGYPLVIDGRRRTALVVLAYVGVPLTMLGVGWSITRS